MRKVLLVVALLLAALLALAAQWPAAHGIGRLTADTGLALHGLSGSVWSGSAAGGSYRGLPLGKLSWTLDPWALAALKLRARVNIDGPRLNASGVLERSFGGLIEAREVRGRLPAAWLQRILNEPFLGLGGDILLAFERARIGADGRLQGLDGESHWQAARLTGRLATELGTLAVVWRTEAPGVIVGLLADAGGALELNGVVTVTADHYEIDARLGARGEQVALRQALEVLGRADASGRVSLRIGGPMLALPWSGP